MKEFSIFRVIFSPVSSKTTIIWVDGPDTGLIGRVLATKLEEVKQNEEADDNYVEEVYRCAIDLFSCWGKTWKLGSQDVRIAGTVIGTIVITEIEYYGS